MKVRAWESDHEEEPPASPDEGDDDDEDDEETKERKLALEIAKSEFKHFSVGHPTQYLCHQLTHPFAFQLVFL